MGAQQEAYILITVKNATKLICIRRIHHHSIQCITADRSPSIDTSTPLKACLTFVVKGNHFFELDVERDAMRKLLSIKQETERIE